MEEEEIQWICPICQSTEYKEITNVRIMNRPNFSTNKSYECSGCSIHFGDIEKFNTITIFDDIAEELLEECSNELLDKYL